MYLFFQAIQRFTGISRNAMQKSTDEKVIRRKDPIVMFQQSLYKIRKYFIMFDQCLYKIHKYQRSGFQFSVSSIVFSLIISIFLTFVSSFLFFCVSFPFLSLTSSYLPYCLFLKLSTLLLSSGCGRHWPDARGKYTYFA